MNSATGCRLSASGTRTEGSTPTGTRDSDVIAPSVREPWGEHRAIIPAVEGYLKLLITSWPPWIFALGAFFIFMFKSKIGDLIARVTGIGKSGITAATATAMKDAQASPTPDPRAGADELMKALDNAFIREMETLIEKELEKRGLKPGVPESTGVLTRYTAVALMTAEFENIESNIFGSQIEILEELNGASGAASAARLRPFYDRAAVVYPEFYGTYSFDTYMGFLVARTLVLRRNGDFGITVKGRTYLMWRANHGKSRRLG